MKAKPDIEGPKREAAERARKEAAERARKAQEEERARKAQEEQAKADPGEPWGLKGEAAYRHAVEILDLSEGFTKADLQKRYRELSSRIHPDAGGSSYFAKQLNWARDVLRRRS